MDEVMQQILAKLEAMEDKLGVLEGGQAALHSEVRSFREEQEVTNKLLTGDSTGIKNRLRDVRDDLKTFRRNIRDWTRKTDEKIDTIEDRLDGVRDALN